MVASTNRKRPPRNELYRLHISLAKRGDKNPMYGNFGNRNPAFKGGTTIHKLGYVQILLSPNDFYFPMADSHHYVMEHRLIMAKQIGRCLLPNERVRHLNGIVNDNRIENLQLLKPTPIVRGYELNNKDHKHAYTKVACLECREEKWVRLSNIHKISWLCRSCRQLYKRNSRWIGGKRIDKNGYCHIKLLKKDPYYLMADRQGYILEHRLIIAKHIGRLLEKWEVVHHIDGNKSNNTISNLLLLPSYAVHQSITLRTNRITKYEQKITALKIQLSNILNKYKSDTPSNGEGE